MPVYRQPKMAKRTATTLDNGSGSTASPRCLITTAVFGDNVARSNNYSRPITGGRGLMTAQSNEGRVDDLFARAIEQPEKQRQVFLKAACGGNSELLIQVNRLLI